jgi:hypothetical protein
VLYRVFPYLDRAAPEAPGGPLHVPRARQGSGRHDNPDLYGALYCARDPLSAVAERIQAFRGQVLTGRELARPDGSRLALAALDDSGLTGVVDLDDPAELVRLGVRPSQVATRARARTQALARRIHATGAPGLSWWSVLEASWINLTLFAERCAGALAPAGEPEPLKTSHPLVVEAAALLGVALA